MYYTYNIGPILIHIIKYNILNIPVLKGWLQKNDSYDEITSLTLLKFKNWKSSSMVGWEFSKPSFYYSGV